MNPYAEIFTRNLTAVFRLFAGSISGAAMVLLRPTVPVRYYSFDLAAGWFVAEAAFRALAAAV